MVVQMRRFVRVVKRLQYVICLFLALNFLAFAKGQEWELVGAMCVRVVDGDTIDVVTNEKKELFRVRLWGIDAPESSQDYGEDATLYLASKLLGKSVHVQVNSTDIYGRLIGKVYCGDEYINATLLETGCAWYYARYAPCDIQLSAAQKKARETKCGVWAAESPLAPWLYRKTNRKTSSNYAVSPLIAAAASGHAEIVEYLIKSGADANGITGKLALFAAIREGQDEVVKILLESGVDVYTKNDAYRQQCAATIRGEIEFHGKCIRVIDGDSIDVCTDAGKIHRVHLHGIDAPELSQKHGLSSQSFLLKSVHGKQLEVAPVGKDVNGAVIANVYKEEEHVNLTMASSGWAWPEESTQNEKSVFVEEALKAKTAKLGIWNEEDQPVVAPWQYRKTKKIVSDTGKIAIFLAASSEKTKIAEQLLAHGVSVDDDIGSGALRYAQDAKAAELCRILVEKGAKVISEFPSINRGAREVATSEIRKDSETDYKKAFSLIRNNFNELDKDETEIVGRDEHSITSNRNQHTCETSSEEHARVDAEEASLIKAAAEGDFETVKVLVEAGVDPNATYSRYRIQAKSFAVPSFLNENTTIKGQTESQYQDKNKTGLTDNSGIANKDRDKLSEGFKSSGNPYSSEITDSQPKHVGFCDASSKLSPASSPSYYHKNQSRKETLPSYSASKETNDVPYTETYTPKRKRYSGSRFSSGYRSGRDNHGSVIICYVVVGGALLFFVYILGVSVDWYGIAIRNRSVFVTKLLYGMGFKLKDRLLYYAAICGDAEITRFLVSKGVKIEQGAYAPLETALKEKHYEVAKILLQHGADARAALSNAIEYVDLECMYFLCSTDSALLSDDDYRESLMFKAIRSKNYNSIACLRRFGVEINTPHLSQAIETGCGWLIIREIINSGVRPTIENINESIVSGSQEIFEGLIDYGINLNRPIETNPLCYAVRYGRPLMVKALLERGVNLNQIEATDKAIIDNLVDRWRSVDRTRFAECLSLLMSKGILEQRCAYLLERLLWLNGSAGVLALIVSHVKNLDYVNSQGQSFLDISLKHGNLECFDVLVDVGANLEYRNELQQTVLMRACYNLLPDDFILHAVKNGADVNARDNTGMTPFLFACMHYSYNMVMHLINHGAQLDSRDMYQNTALLYASRRYDSSIWTGRMDGYLISEELIKRGADVNAVNGKGETCIQIALLEKNNRLIRLLVEHGADVNVHDNKGMTPFIYACKYLSFDIVKIVLKQKVRIDSFDMYMNTALLYACRRTDEDGYQIANEVIERGANVDAYNKLGKTPLHIAVESQNERLVRLLVERGANISLSDVYGKTPVLIAGEAGNRKLLHLLIENGAASQELFSNYPHLLLSSIMCDDYQLAKLLITAGANVNDADSEGKTCLEHAILRRMSEVCLMLIEHGANVLSRRRGSTTLLYKAHQYGLNIVALKIREKGGCMYAHQQKANSLGSKQQVFSW